MVKNDHMDTLESEAGKKDLIPPLKKQLLRI